MSEFINSQATTQSNQGYNSAPALQLRLDCDPIKRKFAEFLYGYTPDFQKDEDGNLVQVFKVTGLAKANDDGCRAILSHVESIINPQVVQGNFPSDAPGTSTMYDNFVKEVNIAFIDDIMFNLYNWDIDEGNVKSIVSYFTNILIPFMTRLIDNKERESYEHTLVHKENTTMQQEKKSMAFLG